MKTFFALVVMPIAAAALAQSSALAAEATYAERLGWGPRARVVLFHCDDAGMSHASNLGAIESIEKGVVTSVSIMMPCPWVPEFVNYVKAHPQTDAGLHLTLNSEWALYRWGPVAGKPAVPGLCDPDGYLWHPIQETAKHATPDEVAREIRAQIEKAEAMGLHPTHIDTHMGALAATPEFLERYIQVGIEKHIPVLAVGGHRRFARIENPEAADRIRKLATAVWNAGLPVIDDLHTASYDWKEGSKSFRFIEVLKDLQPGITMVIVHCSRPTDEFPLITSSSSSRFEDLKAMTDPEVRQTVEGEGIILTSWRELLERRGKLGTNPVK
jgi:chitin disaccharide deacetylase